MIITFQFLDGVLVVSVDHDGSQMYSSLREIK